MCRKSDAARDEKLIFPADVEQVKDIDYAGTKDRYNLLDVYYPKNTEGLLPVIVSFHGGGYVYGTKDVYYHYGGCMAGLGFVFVNFNYHLAPRHKFPTQLAEANTVMEWVLRHGGEYHMDTRNIFMVGDSAGAQMCSQYAAIVSNPDYAALFPFRVPEGLKLNAVGLNCGIYDMHRIVEADKNMRSLRRDMFGKNYEKHGEMLNVTGHITSAYPPSFVMTSYYDFLKENALPMYELIKSRGVECVYRCYGKEGQDYMGHVCHVNMNLDEAREINRDEAEFFKKHLVLS